MRSQSPSTGGRWPSQAGGKAGTLRSSGLVNDRRLAASAGLPAALRPEMTRVVSCFGWTRKSWMPMTRAGLSAKPGAPLSWPKTRARVRVSPGGMPWRWVFHGSSFQWPGLSTRRWGVTVFGPGLVISTSMRSKADKFQPPRGTGNWMFG